MCSGEVHQSKTSSPDDPALHVTGVCACVRVCVADQVFGDTSYIEGPEENSAFLPAPLKAALYTIGPLTFK